VTNFVRANGLERNGNVWAAEMTPRTDETGTTIVWQTTSGQTFYAETMPFTTPQDHGVPGGAQRAAAAVEQRLEEAGIPQLYQSSDAPRLAGILMISGLLVLVGGSAPRLGTRWFWFWSAGAPGGLGVLAYLIFERIRPSTRPLPLAGERDLRWHGFAGFGVYLLAGLVWAITIPWLQGIFGLGLIPG
jgi:hypothetical protein